MTGSFVGQMKVCYIYRACPVHNSVFYNLQVVVMNGCSSLFSSLAAVICDPKGRLHCIRIA